MPNEEFANVDTLDDTENFEGVFKGELVE